MPQLIFTIGLPRSGKSTFATEWALEKPMRAIVSSDSIRLALTGKRYEPLAETMVFATKHIMIRSLLERGFDVCVDGTHSTEISITRLYEIDINAQHVLVQTYPYVCKQRAESTNQLDVIPTIDRVFHNLNLNGFWYVNQKLTVQYENASWNHSPIYEEFLFNVKKKVQERNLYGNCSRNS
jgi:predicted kinase